MACVITKMLDGARIKLKVESIRGAHIEASLKAQHEVHPLPLARKQSVEGKIFDLAVARRKKLCKLLDLKELRLICATESKTFRGANGDEKYSMSGGKDELCDHLARSWSATAATSDGGDVIKISCSALPSRSDIDHAQTPSGLAGFLKRADKLDDTAKHSKPLIFLISILVA